MLDGPYREQLSLFDYLQIYDPRERRLVALADAALTALTLPARAARRQSTRAARGRGAPRRILLLRLERIGDLLMSVPAIDAVRRLAPDAEIDLVVGSWNREIARLLAAPTRIETLDAPWLVRPMTSSGRAAGLLSRAALWRRRRYDLAINLEGDIRSHLLLALSGAARRVGFDMAGGGPVLTDRVAFDPRMHTAVGGLRLAARAFATDERALIRAALEPIERGAARIAVPPEALERALQLVAGLKAGATEKDTASATEEGTPGATERPSTSQVAPGFSPATAGARPIVAVHVGGGRAIKQWPVDRFATVARRLHDEAGAAIVLTGSADDRALVDAVRAQLSAERVLDVSGSLDLVVLAALLAHVDLLVTGDTGPMHVADAVGTRVVAVFGPSDPARYRPLNAASRIVRIDLPCSPCNRVRLPPARCAAARPAPDCLARIAADIVADAALSALIDLRPEARAPRPAPRPG